MHANLVKMAAFTFQNFPSYLAGMRSLCKLFRCSDWRKAIAKATSCDAFKALMKKFVGRFAKWRYETLHYELESLKAMLSWVWHFLIQKVDSIFKEFQDASLLQAVKEALS